MITIKPLRKLTTFMAGAGVATLALMAQSAQAAQFTLDFNTDSAGNSLDAYQLDDQGQNGFSTTEGNIGDIWNSVGIDIAVDGNNPLGLFNSNCLPDGGTSVNGFTSSCNTSGSHGDPDLATGKGSYGNISYDTDPQGNLLIIEENKGDGIPDDLGSGGGTISFDFTDQVISAVLQELVFVDDASGNVTLNYKDGTQEVLGFQANQENQLLNFSSEINQEELNNFSVTFDGSGGLSAVAFSEYETQAVPEGEVTLGLILAGGLFGLRKVYQKKIAGK